MPGTFSDVRSDPQNVVGMRSGERRAAVVRVPCSKSAATSIDHCTAMRAELAGRTGGARETLRYAYLWLPRLKRRVTCRVQVIVLLFPYTGKCVTKRNPSVCECPCPHLAALSLMRPKRTASRSRSYDRPGFLLVVYSVEPAAFVRPRPDTSPCHCD